ncbi:MAG: hypothetical protein C0604_04835 [Clostridiales bacterium]|nr:MAG: hypothetical protein C0604_04835 [Clostridiales bacterium]
MNKFRVSLQKGLNQLRESLVNEGYEVCYEGECAAEPDVVIVSGIDSAYEGIENTQCMINSSGETGMLLIDATNLTHQKVMDLIKNNHCGK